MLNNMRDRFLSFFRSLPKTNEERIEHSKVLFMKNFFEERRLQTESYLNEMGAKSDEKRLVLLTMDSFMDEFFKNVKFPFFLPFQSVLAIGRFWGYLPYIIYLRRYLCEKNFLDKDAMGKLSIFIRRIENDFYENSLFMAIVSMLILLIISSFLSSLSFFIVFFPMLMFFGAHISMGVATRVAAENSILSALSTDPEKLD